MKHLSTIMIAAMAGAFAGSMIAPSGFAQDAMSAWKQRSDLMKSNAKANGAIAKSSNAKEIADNAKTIQDNAQKLANPSLWPANSNVGDSLAKPEIWKNMSDFTAKLQDLQKASAQLVTVAGKGDVQAAKDQHKAVAAACGACHKAYRNEPKKK